MTVTGGTSWPPSEQPGDRRMRRGGGRHRSEPDDEWDDGAAHSAGGRHGGQPTGWTPAGTDPGTGVGVGLGRHAADQPTRRGVQPGSLPGPSGGGVPEGLGTAPGRVPGGWPPGYPPRPAPPSGDRWTGGAVPGPEEMTPGVDAAPYRSGVYRPAVEDGWRTGRGAGEPAYEVVSPDAVVGPDAPARPTVFGVPPVIEESDVAMGSRRTGRGVRSRGGDEAAVGWRPNAPRAVVRRRARRRRVLEWPFLIAFSVVVAVLIRMFVLETFFIPSPSMHPTLVEHDRVLVNKVSYHLHDVHRGDVVVFRRPPNLHVNDKDLIKRVVGLPGDTVEARDRKLYVNGRLLQEPYIPPRCDGTEDFLRVTVPSDHVFVMGDNRCDSTDSRVFGPIPVDLLVGRAFVRIWPLGRWGWL